MEQIDKQKAKELPVRLTGEDVAILEMVRDHYGLSQSQVMRVALREHARALGLIGVK